MLKHTIKLLLVLLMFSSADVYAGDPIPGIDITLTNIDTKKKHQTKTDANGKYWFTDVQPGEYTLTVSSGRESFTTGKKPKEIIVVGSSSKKGNDKVVRKRPGRIKYDLSKKARKLAEALLQQTSQELKEGGDYNSSRSNKTHTKSSYLDDDDDNDGVPTSTKANHNTTRSNRTASKHGGGMTGQSRRRGKPVDKATPILMVQVSETKVHGHVTILK